MNVAPGWKCLLGCDSLDRSDHILQLGDLAEQVRGLQTVMLGHREDEIALEISKAFEEGV